MDDEEHPLVTNSGLHPTIYGLLHNAGRDAITDVSTINDFF